MKLTIDKAKIPEEEKERTRLSAAWDHWAARWNRPRDRGEIIRL